MNLERTDPVNWSTAKEVLRSPKHYLHRLGTERTDTDALRLGRLTHAMVYEPRTVKERYPFMPRFHGGMKDDTAIAKGYEGGREAKQAWEAEHADADAVTPEQYELALGMSGAVLNDPIAGPICTGGYAEQKITWTDPATGIDCRGRVDHIAGRLADLKTTRSVMPRLFRAQAAGLHYFAQVAWYLDGCAEDGITFAHPPAIIAVENVPPHDVLVLEFTDADLDVGRSVYRRALDRIAECRESGVWPGVSGGEILRAEPPAWYETEYSESCNEPMVAIVNGEEIKL